MALFLKDSTGEYSYDNLLTSINGSDGYCQNLQTDSLYSFFLNLIVALVHNRPATLLDSDLSLEEISIIDESTINKRDKIDNKVFNSIEEVINEIWKSSSKITIFTSGTTGQPKNVVHTIETLSRNVKKHTGHTNDIWGFAFNPTHMAGLQVFFQALSNLNPIINLFEESREKIFGLITSNNITHISATPTFYRLLLPIEMSFPTVKRISFGGEKSDRKLYDKICGMFPMAKVTNIYASTEAGTLFSSKGDCFVIPESISDKIKVDDDELLIHQSLLGISDNFIIEKEYYHSGDLIEWVDEKNGVFRFKSRKNELINVGGYKVNPHETEEAISNLPGVQQVIVYHKENSVIGNVLCADIVKNPNTEISTIEIKKILKQKLQDFKVPRVINFVNSLSITRTGKVKRK